MALALILSSATPVPAATPSPVGLRAVSTSASAVSLGWDEVSSAPRYRIQYSTSSKLSKATYVEVVDNAYELTRLKPKTRYYFRVRVITESGKSLSKDSATFSVKTASASGYTYLAPRNLSVTATSSSAASVKWDSRASGIRYGIEYSKSASGNDAVYVRVATPETTITGLKPGSAYYFRVRVTADDGDSLSEYSDLVKGETRSVDKPTAEGTASRGASLRVISYNVKCVNCFSGLPEEGTWTERRGAVVANLRKQDPDVIGIQEASQGWLRDEKGKSISLSQFEDLQQRLGSTYRLANDKRNNCVKSTTPTKCVYADQGASKGTKIIYNSERLTLVDQGSRQLSAVDAGDNERYVAWAILHQKSTGKKFFFTDTHLEQEKDRAGKSDYYELRRTQAREITQVIATRNTKKLPVVSVGDYNSSRFAAPSNAPYDVMLSAGLIDPIGNAYRSTKTAPGATVEKRVNTQYSSFNGYTRTAQKREDWINGSYIDYIFTSPMRVTEYENVVDVDRDGRFNGVIPSDHNLQRATVHLP